MRVLFVLANEYPRAGAAPSRIEKLARGVREAGGDARIIARRDSEHRRAEGQWHEDPAGTLFMPVCPPAKPRAFVARALDYFSMRPRFARAVQQACRDFRPQAVVVYGHSSYIFAPIHRLCRRRGIPQLRDCTEWKWRNPTPRQRCRLRYWDQKLFRSRIVPRLDGLIAISRLWQEQAERRGVPAIRIPAIGEEIAPEVPEHGGSDDGRFTLVYMGVLAARDLPETILDGVRQAVEREADVRFVVIGKTPSGGAAGRARQIAEADPVLRDRVTFTGWVSNEEVARLLADADAFVILREQTWETRACFPTRLPEYLSAGNPVILSEVGDFPLYFRHRENAWLLPPGRRPDALADALVHLAAHRDEARRIGAAGRETGREEFGYRRHARRLLDFLRQLRATKECSS